MDNRDNDDMFVILNAFVADENNQQNGDYDHEIHSITFQKESTEPNIESNDDMKNQYNQDNEEDQIYYNDNLKKSNEIEENKKSKNQLNEVLDERMISNEDDDDDEEEDEEGKNGMINLKAEIEFQEKENHHSQDNERENVPPEQLSEKNCKIINENDHTEIVSLNNNKDNGNNDPNPINQPISINIESDSNDSKFQSNQVLEDNIQPKLIRTKKTFDKNDFEIVSILNKGATANIVKAKYIKNNEKEKIKALKVLEINVMKYEKKIFKIYLENEILRKLNHPNIIHLEGAFEEKEKIFFVLEYLTRGNFSDFLKINYPLNDDTIRFFAAEIVKGLGYLRTKKVIHRNLRPENIMLDEHYHIKIIDFSNAKIVGKVFNNCTMRFEKNILMEDERELDKNGIDNDYGLSMDESAEYLAPEFFQNFPLGFGTDLWALGCIIYQMYVGSTPYSDKSNHLINQNIQKNKIDYPSYIPSNARDFISQLLVDNITKRLGSGEDGSSNDFDHLKGHSYFENINFNELGNLQVPHQSEFRMIQKPQLIANKSLKSHSIVFNPKEQTKEMISMREHTRTIATIKQAIVDKKSPWLHYNRRRIVLDSTPKLEYIDPVKNIVKGVIFLNKECQARQINTNIFELMTPRRVFRFKVFSNIYNVILDKYKR